MSARCCLTPPTLTSSVSQILKCNKNHLVFKADHPGLHHLKGEVRHSFGHRVLQLSQGISNLNEDFIWKNTKIKVKESSPPRAVALRWPERHFHWQLLQWKLWVLRRVHPHQMSGLSQAPNEGSCQTHNVCLTDVDTETCIQAETHIFLEDIL